MAQDSVKVSLEIATQAAELALKNLKKNTEESNSTWNIFKGNFAAGLAVDALKGVFSSVSSLIGSVVEESSKAEQALKNMNIALQNAGIYSEATSNDLQKFSDELERTTIYEAEAAQNSMALFASLTTLSKNGIKQATQAAADLAATLNIDLGTATEMVEKAVNGNVTAFNKMGIEIHKGKTDTETLTNVLKALSYQQGSASKLSDTFEGSLSRLKTQYGNLLEATGNLITQNPVFVDGIKAVTNVLISLSDYITSNADDITLFAESMLYATGIVAGTSIALTTFGVIVGSTTGLLGMLATAARVAWVAVTGPVGLAVGAIVGIGVAIYGLIKYWDDVKIAVYEATAAYLDFSAKALGFLNGDAEKQIKAEAQAWRDKADAVRVAQAAEIEAQNTKNLNDASKSNTQDAAAEIERAKREQKELEQVNKEKIAAKKDYNNQIFLLGDELSLQLEEQRASHEQAMFEISGKYDADVIAKQLEQQQQRLIARQQFESDSLQAQMEAERNKALLIQDAQAREKALRQVAYKESLEGTKLRNKQELELVAQRNKSEETLSRNKIQNQKDTFATIATLSNSSNKELAAIGKAAGMVQIAIDTPIAISKAMAAFPPPFNFAAAALVGTAMAAQAAQLAGLNFATGGIVPGTSYSGDRVAANVNSREMILNMGQQKRLFDIANGGGNSGGTTNQLLVELISAVKAGASIHIDGREIVSVVRDGLQAGRTI